MPVLQGRTREELRVHVGHLLNAVRLLEADATTSTTTFVTDDIPITTADDANGKWLVFTGGQSNIDGEIRQITDSSVSSNRVTLTFYPSLGNAPASPATAELWDQWYDPVTIHNFINQTIVDATGHIFDPVEDISLHTGGASRFDIPTTFEVLYDVYLRTQDSSTLVIPVQTWDESVAGDFTVTEDTEDLLFGRSATQFAIDSSVSNGDLASDSITSLDLSAYTHIEFPIKVRDTVVASDLILRLSATASGAETDKLIAIPAITQDTDTWVRVAMTDNFNPSAATDIISVALEMNANAGDNIVWVGEIRATRNDGDRWVQMPRHLWMVDKESRDLVFIRGGEDVADYRLMKLKGGDNPVLLTADGTATEVPESYIIYRTVGLALRLPIRGENSEQTRARIAQANDYLGMAEMSKGNFPMLKNARYVT